MYRRRPSVPRRPAPGRKNVREIALRRLRQTETRHWDQRARFPGMIFSPSR